MHEACNALAIDTSTLYRWCKQAHITPQQDAHDKRRRSLTALQVQDLARLHQVPLASDTLHTQEKPPDEILPHLESIEHRLEALEHELRNLVAALHLHQELQEALQPVIAAQPPQTTPIPQQAPQRPPGNAGEVVWLTPELVGWRSFCRAHGMSEGAGYKAIRSGRLPTITGEWVHGKRFTEALDQNGRQKFYELYHTNPRFHHCSDCPHS